MKEETAVLYDQVSDHLMAILEILSRYRPQECKEIAEAYFSAQKDHHDLSFLQKFDALCDLLRQSDLL